MLPKYLIICGSLELASKQSMFPHVASAPYLHAHRSYHRFREDGLCHYLVPLSWVCDHARKVCQYMDSFFVVLKEPSSDFYYLVDSQARERRYQATQYLADALSLKGGFSVDDSTFHGSFSFTNVTMPPASRIYSANGCYRSPDWPWYLQAPPTWTLLFLVPLYGIFSALASFQPVFSRELPVMVFISCCAYAANRVGPFDRLFDKR